MKMAMALDKSSIEKVLSLFSSLTLKITSYFEIIVEVRSPDTKEENVVLSAEKYQIASKKQQDSVQDVIEIQTKRTTVVMEKSDMKMKTIVNCMKKSITLMDNLKMTVLDMSSFWKHLEGCCCSVAEDTNSTLEDISLDPGNKFYLEDSGVKDSMYKFNALWKVLKEVCTESKKELKKVAEALKSAYTEILSPEEAMSKVQANFY